MDVELTFQEARFVAEYLENDGNQVRAAMAAWPKLTYQSASKKAQRMLEKENVVAALTGAKVKVIEKSIYDRTRLLNRLIDASEADVADLFTEDGRIKPVHEWPMAFRTGLVTSWKTDEVTGEIKEVKLDRGRLLDQIGKHVDIGAWDKSDKGSGEIHIHISEKDAKL
jgi:phage terminase small subunit